MSLDAAVRVDRGAFSLDVALAAADGELVVVLGPNGAGKSTLLGALAGLVPTAGRITIGDSVVLDDGAGVDLPPEDRPVGVVFQDGRLFPHLTLLDNVAFGLRSQGARKAAARAAAHDWLERIGLADRAGERPAALSGGQAQLVALARALATEPRLLLLDEPLSALDAQVRPAVRADLRRHLASFEGSRLLVTHDPVEALVLADRLVVVEDGRVVQEGTPDEVRRRPAPAYAASVVGLSFWRTTDGRPLRAQLGRRLVTADPGPRRPVLAVVPERSRSTAVGPRGRRATWSKAWWRASSTGAVPSACSWTAPFPFWRRSPPPPSRTSTWPSARPPGRR